ncbi:hypothetical protein VTI74DRAFT_10290 [Chaetomium olivicolor]
MQTTSKIQGWVPVPPPTRLRPMTSEPGWSSPLNQRLFGQTIATPLTSVPAAASSSHTSQPTLHSATPRTSVRSRTGCGLFAFCVGQVLVLVGSEREAQTRSRSSTGNANRVVNRCCHGGHLTVVCRVSLEEQRAGRESVPVRTKQDSRSSKFHCMAPMWLGNITRFGLARQIRDPGLGLTCFCSTNPSSAASAL